MSFNHIRANIRNGMVGMTILEARACAETFGPTGYRPHAESHGYAEEFTRELEEECHHCSGCTYCEGITPVVFLWDKDEGDGSDVFAVFPALAATPIRNLNPHLIGCYAHVGQHSGAALGYCDDCEEVTDPIDYTDLFEELVAYGYTLRVVGKSRIGIEYTNRFASSR